MDKVTILLLCGLLLAVSASASSVTLQGQLMQTIDYFNEDTVRMPCAGATVSMTFRLYTAIDATAAVWTETQNVTTDESGIYTVQLGSITPLNVSGNQAYWLGVTVEANAEMTPRLPFGSVLHALTVQGVDLTPHPMAPYACSASVAGSLALNSSFMPCICNGDSWRFVGYGTPCQW